MKIVRLTIMIVLLGGGVAAAILLFPKNQRRASVSGTIETDEVQVASRYGGRITRIIASEGAWVKSGELLMELEAPELLAEKKEAEAALEEARAGPRPQEIQAAKDEWQAQTAELELARSEARRNEDLFQRRTISELERERSSSRAAALGKSVAAAKSRYELLLAGTRPERIAQAAAKLATIESRLKEMRVVAPSDCFVEVVSVKVGDVVGPNVPMATLLLRNHLWARVYVPESWLGFIQEGERVTARVDSFPNRVFDGVVEQVNRAAEFTPRNAQTPEERIKLVFGIKVRFPDPTAPLRPGMSADIFFPGAPAARP